MYQGVLNIEQRQYTPTLKPSLTPKYERKCRATYTGRKVVDVGILTIEEVITARGKRAYLATARDGKRATATDLKKIITGCVKELQRIGDRKPRGEYYRQYWNAKKDKRNQTRREEYALKKEEINERRRQKYAIKRQMLSALADLPSRTS